MKLTGTVAVGLELARELGERGEARGSHGGLAEQVSGLGGGLETVNRSRRSSVPVGEDDDGGDEARPPASRSSVERARQTRRSF